MNRHMKRNFRIIPILIAFLWALPALALAKEYKVLRVVDGDTLKAEGHDITVKVRLVGIDAPETSKKKGSHGQPYSQRATKYLAGLTLNKTVDIRGYGLDRYNRILGVIFLSGKNINLEMVRSGLAEVYRGMSPHRFKLIPYWQAEKEAREAKKGMWVQGNKYVSPKEWRKTHRGR